MNLASRLSDAALHGEILVDVRAYEAAGGVIAEVHILRGQSPDGSRSYPVVSLKPIDILEMEEAPALPDTSGAAEDDEPPF